MSIGNNHIFSPLNKDSKALAADQRLVRLIAKGKEKHENLQASLCVSIPVVSQDVIVDVIDKLLPHVVGMVQDAQDKMIREWRLEHGRNEIPQDVFNVDHVIAWLDANARGDRVSSEYLTEWFIDGYAEIAKEFIQNAMGGAVTDTVIAQKTTVLCDMFTGFASPKYSPSIPVCKAIIRFAGYAVERGADARMNQYGAKASEILARKESEVSADALGF